MRKRIFVFLIVLMMASLACMESVVTDVPFITETAPAATLTNVPATDRSVLIPTLTNVVPLRTCAKEIANQAENLRIGADVHAQSIMQLLNGDEMIVISQADPNWWLVESGAHVGYARSLYLKIVDCEGVK
jgi:hypothetical protein